MEGRVKPWSRMSSGGGREDLEAVERRSLFFRTRRRFLSDRMSMCTYIYTEVEGWVGGYALCDMIEGVEHDRFLGAGLGV